MIKYVLGAMFSPDFKQILLIRKLKPEWQNGKLNLIGGKIELGEGTYDAMVREFKEETGLETTQEQWTHFCTMQREDDFICWCYWTTGQIDEVEQMEEEVPEIWDLYNEFGNLIIPRKALFNLHWLITYALDADIKQPLKVTYN